MCGITGIVELDGAPVSATLIRRMTRVLAHRGPDGEGFFVDGPVGIGHRRLAVIDPSPAGHQPMQTLDRRFTITYNGTVYNFEELRVELEALGHIFRTRCDTEVVLEAFAEWGVEALSRFNGMFAFAIWDRSRYELHLCRDRYGIKPLYYTLQGSTFMFASEVKALLSHPDLDPGIDLDALAEYLTFQNLFTDRTLFRDVRMLPAGSYLVVRTHASSVGKPVRYWDFDFQDSGGPHDLNEAGEELDRLIHQAVQRQLVSDVPIGAYLSGGVDSASVVAIASRRMPNLRTFTVGFDLTSAAGLELNYDERRASEALSAFLRTEHYEMVLKSGDMERVMRRLVWHLEEPRVGQSYPNYYAAQLASKFGKVVLAGVGGDEIFGGYPWRYYRNTSEEDFDSYIDNYYAFWQRLVSNTELRALLSPIADATKAVWTRDIFRDVFAHHPKRLRGLSDSINHSLYFEAKTFLHGLLVVEDKLSMAHGLETRVPFLDNDLVDFAQSLPVAARLAHVESTHRVDENEAVPKKRVISEGRDGKRLLRQVMESYVPLDVTRRRKQGFSAPDASWFRGESIDYVSSLLFRRAPAVYDYLDRRTVEDLLEQHFQGVLNRRLLVWSLMYLELWCQVFLGGAAPPAVVGEEESLAGG